MPTTTDLATRVLKRLGVVDPDENPTATEAADVVEIMQAVYEELKELGHIDWTLTDIPTRYQQAFVDVIGGEVAANFGVDGDVVQFRAERGRKRIYALNERKVDPRSSPVVDF